MDNLWTWSQGKLFSYAFISFSKLQHWSDISNQSPGQLKRNAFHDWHTLVHLMHSRNGRRLKITSSTSKGNKETKEPLILSCVIIVLLTKGRAREYSVKVDYQEIQQRKSQLHEKAFSHYAAWQCHMVLDKVYIHLTYAISPITSFSQQYSTQQLHIVDHTIVFFISDNDN